jgi:hypothetical protein
MSVIQAIAAAQYTMMKNNAAYNMISANNSRLGLISSMPANNISFGSLAAMDTEFEIQALTNNLQYLMAKAMLEQVKKQQQEDAKSFSIFA